MRLIDADALIEQFRPFLHIDETIEPDVVIDFIRTAKTVSMPPNNPLTLEELREMDGEPVYVARSGGRSAWMVVDRKLEMMRGASGKLAFFIDCGKTWIAYRRKPEEGTMV